MPWNTSSPGGGFTTNTPWFPFAPGRETANIATQISESNSLLSRSRALIRARHASAAMQRGDLRLVTSGDGRHVLAFFRTTADDRVLVVHNVGDSMLTAGPYATTATASVPVFANPWPTPTVGAGSGSVTLLPRTTGIWRLK
jgi:glycosidase